MFIRIIHEKLIEILLKYFFMSSLKFSTQAFYQIEIKRYDNNKITIKFKPVKKIFKHELHRYRKDQLVCKQKTTLSYNHTVAYL